MNPGPEVTTGGGTPADGRRHLIRAAGVVGAATLLSRILGYVRDMIIAVYFGAGFASDAFFAAFRIPSLLRELLGEGALSASFIPVFAGEAAHKGRARAMYLAGAAFTALTAVAGTLVILGILLAPALVTVVAPGFRGVPGKWELTVTLTRWMFPFLLLVALAALLGGLLNALGHFATPALAPASFNVAMIAAILLLAPRLRPPVLALSMGVLLGGAAMLGMQILPSARRGFAGPRWPHPDDPSLRRIARLMLPATAGLGVTQVNVAVSGLLASFLAQGSVSYLFYAMRLIQFPIGVVGVAIGTVALPAMSAGAARESRESVASTLAAGLRLAIFLTAPILVGLLVFGRLLVRVLFQRGAFTPEAAAATGLVLLGYTAGLLFYVSNRLLTAAFYAFQDTRSPVRIAALAVGVNVVAGWALMGPLRAPGLALGTALASMVNCLLLCSGLRIRLGRWWEGELLRALARTAGAAVLAAGVGLGVLLVAPAPRSGGAAAATLLIGSLAMGAGYLIVARLLACEEIRWAAHALLHRAKPAPGAPPLEDGV